MSNHDKPVSVIVGARPNFVKIARLIPALQRAGLTTRLIHTGQHYDEKMSQSFFMDLDIPRPDINLGIGSGTHVWQITEVMRQLEKDFGEIRPRAVLVVGDVNSTLAAALTACKMNIPVGHVEAGLRSFDWTMPEESNRILTDSISTWLFTSEPSANENLTREGVEPTRVHFVGNVMIDTLVFNLQRARQVKSYESFGLLPGKFAVLTLHRPSNVDDVERLGAIMAAISSISASMPVLLPVHPRTKKRLEEFNGKVRLDENRVRIVEPQGYLAMLGLMDAARLVLTDSGGVQEETTALGVPCLTLRENTERPVTVEEGSNKLVGWRTADILKAVNEIGDAPRKARIPRFWDGSASERIAGVMQAATC